VSKIAQALARKDKQFVWHPFTQMREWIEDDPLIIESGRGATLRDVDGNEYIDGVSSLWVNIHGHRNATIDRAVRAQLGKIAHSTLLGLANVPSTELAERLVRITPPGLDKVFYSDNGSTAVEVALKIASRYWQQKRNPKPGKTGFISFTNAYHGDTTGAVSVGGIDLFHTAYSPLLFKTYGAQYPYCYRCPYDKSHPRCALHCVTSLERILARRASSVAAVIIEPIVQGAAGMIVSPPGFLKAVRELATQNDVLLIADEVATGFGRTGKMFACEHEDVQPDMMAVAKGITAGYLPLAATLTTDRIYRAFLGGHSAKKTFFHGHTYTGNPLACAAALASLDLFESRKTLDTLQRKIKLLSDLLEPLNQFPHVGEIRRKGFMVGIELVKGIRTRKPFPWSAKVGARVCSRARRHGVILRPLGDVVVIMPPYVITSAQIRTLVNAVASAIREEFSI